MNYLNLGCGQRFRSGWINVDFNSTAKEVMAHDLTQGIPFLDNSFDVVYQSHVLEHFSKVDALPFLKECYRVLRSKGILRIVVPDLEQIVRNYLLVFEELNSASQEWDANYEWILLEMYDQVARNSSGGNMRSYLAQEYIPNLEFVLSRGGMEIKSLIEAECKNNAQLQKLSNATIKDHLKQIYRFLRYPSLRREFLLKTLLRQEYQALQIGRFRLSGEVHQWMYDRYSLSKLLSKCGFHQIVQRNATESYIPNWVDFCLDTQLDGLVYKPDSLFIEAVKPS